MTDRAVSEVIAFILVFSIVITSVGLLYTVGFGSLGQFQQVEQDRSAEQAFEAVAVGFDDVQRGRATVREVSLDLSGRTLYVDEDTALTVSAGGTDVDASGALVYGRGEDTEIAYQAGGVVRSQGENAQLMSRPPRFRCSDDHAVVSVVQLEDDVNTSVSSSGNVQIEAQLVNATSSRLEVVDPSASSVTVDYAGTVYENAWRRYFRDDDNAWSPSGTCNFGGSGSTGEVYVRKTVLDVSFTVG